MSPAAQKKTDEFQIFLQAMQDMLGVVIDEDEQNSVSEKLFPVLEANGYDSLAVLAEAIRQEEAHDLRLSVLQAITERDAAWFPYPEISSLLNEYILPGLINSKVSDFRIWMVGCGQGQIAYSLAMVVDTFVQHYGMGCNIEIIACEMAEEAVERAAEGRFESSMLTGLPESYKQHYLTESDGVWEVNSSIRSMIHFATCNLLDGVGHMGHCDLIICPDELIYFSTDVKSEILHGFADLLDSAGMLIVGTNEPVISFCDRFQLVNHETGTFYRQVPYT